MVSRISSSSMAEVSREPPTLARTVNATAAPASLAIMPTVALSLLQFSWRYPRVTDMTSGIPLMVPLPLPTSPSISPESAADDTRVTTHESVALQVAAPVVWIVSAVAAADVSLTVNVNTRRSVTWIDGMLSVDASAPLARDTFRTAASVASASAQMDTLVICAGSKVKGSIIVAASDEGIAIDPHSSNSSVVVTIARSHKNGSPAKERLPAACRLHAARWSRASGRRPAGALVLGWGRSWCLRSIGATRILKKESRGVEEHVRAHVFRATGKGGRTLALRRRPGVEFGRVSVRRKPPKARKQQTTPLLQVGATVARRTGHRRSGGDTLREDGSRCTRRARPAGAPSHPSRG